MFQVYMPCTNVQKSIKRLYENLDIEVREAMTDFVIAVLTWTLDSLVTNPISGFNLRHSSNELNFWKFFEGILTSLWFVTIKHWISLNFDIFLLCRFPIEPYPTITAFKWFFRFFQQY